MSITINLIKNKSDTNVLTKSLETLSTITGVLKDDTDILNPSILIEGSLPTNCNYFQIPDFNRYYFITGLESVANDLFKITGHVDVLSTYADSIRNCSGIIARQESEYNLYVDDGSFKVYQNPTFSIKQFDSGFNTAEFILAVAGS